MAVGSTFFLDRRTDVPVTLESYPGNAERFCSRKEEKKEDEGEEEKKEEVEVKKSPVKRGRKAAIEKVVTEEEARYGIWLIMMSNFALLY